jgi:hypothetical protein
MCLVNLEDEIYLTRKEILSVSDYFFHMTPYSDRIEINKLTNKICHSSERYIFLNSHEMITIGRDKKCDIFFNDDKAFSRIHITIRYDKDLKLWKIKDGNLKHNSTNGTWYFFIF